MSNPDYVQLELRQGLEADVPILASGELGFATDSGNLYVGTGSVNLLVGNIYVPANPSYWSGSAPATIKSAIDRLASAVHTLVGGPIP